MTFGRILLSFFVVCSYDLVGATVGNFGHRWSSPLSFHLNNVNRVRRQAVNSVVPPDSPELCSVQCLQTLQQRLAQLQSLQTSDVQRSFDPENFKGICQSYKTSQSCFDKCQTTSLKSFIEKSLSMLNFMCVERFDAFNKNLPCMSDASVEASVACKSTCSSYEASVQKLETLAVNNTMLEQISQSDLRKTVGDSCKYVQCLNDCGNPLMAKKCGQEAADLERETTARTFQAIQDTFAAGNVGASFPDECLKLSSVA